MRILHTSDWHLGASLDGVPREPEQALFLDWLLGVIEESAIDAVIVAGDVFDQGQAPAEALRLYYGFLRRLSRTRVRKAVFVGGNHDSAAHLDAPREVLAALDVHVVGGLRNDAAGRARCLCPVEGADGTVIGVVAAVPFVHEYWLGVRTTDGDEASVREQFRAAFRELYRALADEAEARWPGVPLVATGHLTCLGYRKGDTKHEVHQVGTIGGLPPDIFDPRFRYVALGHLHRGFGVAGSVAHYSGSPVAYRLEEAAMAHRVLIVDVPAGDGEPTVQAVPVPTHRRIVALRGTVEEVAAALRGLEWSEALEPVVYARVSVERYRSEIDEQLFEVLRERGKRAPRLVDIAQELSAEAARPADAPVFQRRDVTPEEVFRLLCERKGEPVDDELLRLFREVAAEPVEAPAGAGGNA